jgi:hypothetical protein
MSEEPENAPKAQEKGQTTFSKAVNVASYPVAAGVGAYAFNYSVDNQLFDHLKRMDATQKLQDHTVNFREIAKNQALKIFLIKWRNIIMDGQKYMISD